MKPYLDAKRRFASRKEGLRRRRLKSSMIISDGVLRYAKGTGPIIFRYPFRSPSAWAPYLVPLRFPTLEAYNAFVVEQWDTTKSPPYFDVVGFQLMLEKLYLP